MAFDVSGKSVLVTGSTDGLGKRLAMELSRRGSSVIIHGRNPQKVNAALDEVRKLNPNGVHDSIQCDFHDLGSIQASFARVKKLDILVNNAGVWWEGKALDATPEKIIELLTVDLGSYLVVSRVLLPILQASDFSQILNVISVAGYEVPPKDVGPYTFYGAVKYGLQGFTENMAKEFENTNLRVMGFYPGGMATDMFDKAGFRYGKQEPWMMGVQEAVEAILFMLTRSKDISVKRMDLIKHQF